MPRKSVEIPGDFPVSSIELGQKGSLIITKTRQTFKHTPQFTMTMMSAMIDAGNFARFPYMAYKNGQGSFIIAYFITLFLVGMPLLTMEMYLGQFSSRGNIKTFRSLGHLYGGIGFSQTLVTFLLMSLTGPAVALTIFYFSQSFYYELPWSYCKPEWGEGCHNETNSNDTTNFTSSAKFYFKRIVMREHVNFTGGLEAPSWDLSLALFFAWILAFLVLSAGLESVARVNYFLALLPVVLIFIMLVETCHLEGSYHGVKTMLTPKWMKLFSVEVWSQALFHALSSVGIGVGTNLMYASYNRINTNLRSVASILCGIDFLGSIMAATTLYAAMGHLAYDLHSDIGAVMTVGQDLWVLYSSVVINLGTPYVISAVFFFIFVALGLGTLVSYQQLIITQYTDYDAHFFNSWHLSGLTAVIGFGIGLIYITPQGKLLTDMADAISLSVSAEFISWIATCSISYGYGLRHFCWDVKFMTRNYPNLTERIVWRISPFVTIFCTLFFSDTADTLKKVSKNLGNSILILGIILIFLFVSPIVIVPIVEIVSTKAVGLRKNFELMISNDNWEPIAEKYIYKRYVINKEDELMERTDQNRKWLRFWNDFIAKERP